MGHVYRAWDARLHREVAIKLLNHEYTMPGMRERFLREARAASALNHPNICTIFDIGEQDGDPYLVMELLQGETLKDRILSHTMPIEEIVAVARDTAEALGAAHSKGVVHRDVKPANIFLVDKPNGGTQAKVLDFGLAKIEGGVLGARGRSLDLTSVGATVGTLAYMSPEQARGEPLDSRSDLFSLGVVMYEMATRHVPFQGATSALVFVQLLNHSPEPVREWNEAVPRELEKIIFKLLAKERTARFQTARDLELALIALSDKGSGGWLRKAVAAVPLVRAQDPVAREKRLTRAKTGSDSGLQSPPPRSITPVPAISASAVPFVEEAAPAGSVGDQVLRPIARMPRPDGTPVPVRNTPMPARKSPVAGADAASMFTPVPATNLPGDALSPSQRLGQTRLNAQVAPSEDPEMDSVLPAHHPSGTRGPAPDLRAPTAIVPSHFALEPPAEDAFASGNDAGLDADPTSEEWDVSAVTPELGHRRWKLPFQPLWLGLSGLVLIFGACLTFIYFNHSRFSATPLNRSDVVALTEVENRTGDKSLDDSVTEMLRFDLAQSSYLTLRSGDSYRAARRLILIAAGESATDGGIVLARKSSERLGARAYVFGFVSGSSSPYTVHIDLRDVSSNEVLASAEAHPDSLQQVPGAVDQVAGDLRVSLGEPRASVDATSTPVASEASANMAAVQLYAQAEALLAAREPIGAVAQLQQAISLDPKFTQAHFQLAILYQQLRAETAAAESARLALTAAGSAGERTRALIQAAFERESTGDYIHASALLRTLIAVYPHDSEALAQLAEVLRLEGRMGEALGYAQQAYTEDAFNAAAYTQAELALIGLDRYDAAYQLDVQAQRLSLARPGESLAAADLDRRQEVVDDLVSNLPVGKIEYRPDWDYGIYLDNAGRLAAGTALWRSRAEAARQNDSLKSAASFLLAQGALDRALLGDCSGALALQPTDDQSRFLGRIGLFNSGMVSAFCEDGLRARQVAAELRRRYPQSFEVNGYFLADLQAAEDLHDHQPAAALNDLAGARAFDLISLTPFLRGQAHVAQHEIAVGIVDFQTELAHRGVTYVVGNDVYPAAQIGVARAFADSGDLANSGEAYRRFLGMWTTADPSTPLLIEARTHSGS
jgi:serine/threonine protein kinase